MILLSISIVIALLITIALPIGAGFWLNKRLSVPWRVVTYGALGYFIVQAVITLLFNGFAGLVENQTITLTDRAFRSAQLGISVFMGALIGVIVRWAGIKYLNEDMKNLEDAYGIGIGYGAAESIMLVGLPLLSTFIAMLGNFNIDPQTTTLDPAVISQIDALWRVPFYIPLAGSLERIASLVMHITVTILILQVFTRSKAIWLAAAFGVELLVNGLIAGLAEAGLLHGWVILISLVLMVGNLYILYRLRAYEFDITKANSGSEIEMPS